MHKKMKREKRSVIILTISVIFILVGLVAHLGNTYWKNLSFQESCHLLKQMLKGESHGIGKEMIFTVVLPLVLIVIALILLYRYARKHHRRKSMVNITLVVSFVFVTFFGGSFAIKHNAVSYVLGKGNSFVGDHYVNPDDVEMTFPKKKRNLIYIYLESMEMTSTSKKNGGNFKENLIPELTSLSKKYENFSGQSNQLDGAYSMPGATWTMGGVFAQTSGLPLQTAVGQNAMYSQPSFFPNLTTLGDILEKQDYNQTFMLGSNCNFAGRTTYFKNHGNFQIEDYKAAIKEGEIPSDYYVFWGYEDQKLFSFSKQKLAKISASNKPFNFTMLTVDTHFPSGYKCPLCKDEFGNQYYDVMACSSRQVASFVKWCQSQSWYKNTTIVINGDHPTMSSAYKKAVKTGYTRKTYTCYINADAKRETNNTRVYTTMDNFPTTLAALGVKIKGDRLGLGTNLFSKTPTLSEVYGYKAEKNALQHTSNDLLKLEPIADIEAIKRFQFYDARRLGHSDKMTVEKVKDRIYKVRISDFKHYKYVSHIYIKASTNPQFLFPQIQSEMKCIDLETDTYEGTINLSKIKKNYCYVEVDYEDPDCVNYPLNRQKITF
jgi:phosphoglycerol transferase